jgi:hypothetical protein
MLGRRFLGLRLLHQGIGDSAMPYKSPKAQAAAVARSKQRRGLKQLGEIEQCYHDALENIARENRLLNTRGQPNRIAAVRLLIEEHQNKRM